MSKEMFNENINALIPTTNTHIEKIPFPKEEVVVIIDQLVRLQTIRLANEDCDKEIIDAMGTLNEALSLVIKSPRLIIGNPK
jgi:hypothetical protein